MSCKILITLHNLVDQINPALHGHVQSYHHAGAKLVYQVICRTDLQDLIWHRHGSLFTCALHGILGQRVVPRFWAQILTSRPHHIDIMSIDLTSDWHGIDAPDVNRMSFWYKALVTHYLIARSFIHYFHPIRLFWWYPFTVTILSFKALCYLDCHCL